MCRWRRFVYLYSLTVELIYRLLLVPGFVMFISDATTWSDWYVLTMDLSLTH